MSGIGAIILDNCPAKLHCAVDSTTARVISDRGYGFYALGDSAFGLYYGTENETEYLTLVSYKGEGETVVEVPAYVTRLGESAFKSKKTIEEIVLPEGLTKIGSSAFSNCTSMRAVNIPEGVTSIGGSAFYGCEALEGIEIPEGVTSIGSSAFQRCKALREITLPSSVVSIGSYAFRDCTNLKSVTLGENMSGTGIMMLDNCPAKLHCAVDSVTARALSKRGYDFYALGDTAFVLR